MNQDDPSLVEGALDKELDRKLDVDHDQVSDADELAALESPAIPGSAPLCGDTPTYGCGARIAPVPPRSDEQSLVWAGLMALGLGFVRRRARKPRA